MTVAALVLAAGKATRFNGVKQLAPLGDSTVLGRTMQQVRSWPVDETWVVLGAAADDILEAVDFGDATIIINESYAEGIASSLKVGIDAIQRSSRVEAILIVLGDQPEIPDEVPGALIEALHMRKGPAIIPKYRYERGNPVLAGRWLWERLMSLEGDHGAKALFETHPEWVDEVWFDTLPPRDVDTPEDLINLETGRTS